MQRARITSALALIGTVGLLAACGSSSDDATGAGDAEAGGTLRVLTPGYPAGSDGQEAFQRVVDAFAEEYPNIEVEPDFATFENLNEKISTSIAGGLPYDVLVTGIGWVQPFAAKGAIADLSEHDVTEESLGAIVDPALIPAATFDGAVYGIPLIAAPKPLAYRRSMFEAAGLDPDTPPDSWDQLRDYAEQLTQHDASGAITRVGFDFWAAPSQYRQDFVTFLGSTGTPLFDEDGAAQFNGPEGVAALEFMSELTNDADVTEFGRVASTGQPLVFSGDAGMGFVGGHVDCEAVGQEVCDDLVFFNLSEDTPAMFTGGQLASVGANSELPDAAYAFIEAMSTPEAEAELAALNFAVPAGLGADEASIVQSNPASRFSYASLEAAVFEGGSENWLDLRDVFNAELDRALLGEVSAQEALDALADEAGR